MSYLDKNNWSYNFDFTYTDYKGEKVIFDYVIEADNVVDYFANHIRGRVKKYILSHLRKRYEVASFDELDEMTRDIFTQTFEATVDFLLDFISDYDCPINIFNPRELLKIDDDFKTYLIDLYEYTE